MTTLRNIQTLRAVAAYAVVVHHLFDAVNYFIAEGRYMFRPAVFASGVDVFFVLSGFIMTHTARSSRVRRFVAARVARVVPTYWLLTAFVVLVHAAGSNLFGHLDYATSDVLRSLFFVPRFDALGMPVLPILYVGWTLNYEMLFYILFAATLLIHERGIADATLAALVLALVVGGSFSSDPYMTYWGDSIILEFAAGVLTWHVWQRVRLGVAASIGIALAALLMLVVSEVASLALPRALQWGIPATMLVYAALCLESAGWSVHNKFVIGQGNASYAVYLLHPLLWRVVGKLALVSGLAATDLGVVVTAALGLVTVCVVSTLFHHGVERPLTRLTSRLLGLQPSQKETRPGALPSSSQA